MKRAASPKEHLERLDLAVQVENVTVAYDGRPVLWNISFDVPAGSLLAIIGPNKAGKSTLIKTVLGLVKPASGNVYIFSRPTGTLKNDIAYVPEQSSVRWSFPTTVFDMALMGSYNRLKRAARPGINDREAAAEALEKTGLAHVGKKSVGDLSPSEKQRALVARALVQNARIYALDEPFLFADEESRRIILKVIEELKASGKTILAAHHDIMTTPRYFDTAVFINVKKIACGAVSEIFHEEILKATYGRETAIPNTVNAGRSGSENDHE